MSFHFPGPSATETSCLNEAVREFKWEQCQDQPADGTWSEPPGSKLGMLCIPLKWDGMPVPAEDDGDFICNMIT